MALVLCTGCIEAVYPKKKVEITRPPEVLPREAKTAVTGERELLGQAEEAHIHSRFPEALEKYQAFLKAYPKSSQADSALAAMGQIRERLGQTHEAISVYQELLAKYPHSNFVDESRRRLAGLLLKTGRYKPALVVLTDLLKRTTRVEENARLRIMLGRAHLGLDNRSQAMEFFLTAHGETSDTADKDEAHRFIRSTIRKMTLDELTRSQTLYGLKYPGGYVAYILAYRYYQDGRMEDAASLVRFLMDNFPGHELLRDAQALGTAIEGKGPPPPLDLVPVPPPAEEAVSLPPEEVTPEAGAEPPLYKSMDVACVLPLSDTRAAKYGRQVLTGLKLAFKSYQSQTQDFRSNLIIYDSKGDPERAAGIIEQVAGQPNILAVVGPLMRKVAAKAAPKAEEMSVPLIALTQQVGVTEIGPNIFRLFLTPRAQAQAVARYAVQVLGMTRLAILHPSDGYGNKMRDYFWDEVNRLGAEVTGVEAYDPKATDFSEQIQKLAGVGKVRRRVVAGRKVRVHFDAVFLPDGYRAVAMIAPQFAYHDITTVRLLGTALWHTPKLLSSAARYTQRSIFPTPFFAAGERPEVQRFVEVFRAGSGDEEAVPGKFMAYGYDAGALLLSLMDQDHVSSREDLVQALLNMGPFSGVTARFTFSPEGEYRAEPTLLTVDGEEFALIQ
ncbi:MAG: penicillin-binding protein activator [Thermodesulfobacteriota bacterium]|nr:penicillin-binding protein activator [Thermodesulfobacteriota bacterium]